MTRLRDKLWFQHVVTVGVLVVGIGIVVFGILPGIGILAHAVWNQFMKGWSYI